MTRSPHHSESERSDSHSGGSASLWESAELKAKLAEAQGASATLATLFHWRKERDHRLSLAYLCRRSGISSRGYLSEVLAGKKRLNQKYVEPLAQALALDGAARELWLNAAALERTDSEPERRELMAYRAKVLKNWAVERDLMPRGGDDHYFVMEVFTSFGLFRNEPQLSELVTYFGTRLERPLGEALKILMRWGLIEAHGEAGFRVKSSQVVFSGSEDGFSHLRFLRKALDRTRDEIPHWFGQREKAFFQSVIISARHADYPAFLAKLRQQIELLKAELETDDADSLVAFNLFSFPLSGALAERSSDRADD